MFPHPCLLDIVAGRRVSAVTDPEHLMRSAVTHRMECLLAAELERTAVALPAGWQEQLIALDLRSRAGYHSVEAALAETFARLGPFADRVMLYKGIAASELLYSDDPEARPSADVDLFLDPAAAGELDSLVARLDPEHRLIGHLTELVHRRYLRVVEVKVGSVLVDIHLDPMNLAVDTRSRADIWRQAVDHRTRAGLQVRVPDPTTMFLQLCMNGLRDNFAQLLQVLDVAKAAGAPGVDFDTTARTCRAEGWDALVTDSVCFASRLAPFPSAATQLELRPSRWRARAIAIVAPTDRRLQGDDTWSMSRRRELLLPLAIKGRRLELLRAVVDRAVPPRAVLDAQPSATGGSRLVKAFRYRYAQRTEMRSTRNAET